jgi:hypothetical protein
VKVLEEVVHPHLLAQAGFQLGLEGGVAALSEQVTSHEQLHKQGGVSAQQLHLVAFF